MGRSIFSSIRAVCSVGVIGGEGLREALSDWEELAVSTGIATSARRDACATAEVEEIGLEPAFSLSCLDIFGIKGVHNLKTNVLLRMKV